MTAPPDRKLPATQDHSCRPRRPSRRGMAAARQPDDGDGEQPRSNTISASDCIGLPCNYNICCRVSGATRRSRQRFRTFPASQRTCKVVWRHADGVEIGGSVYGRRRSIMNQQAVQEWRRRGLNIAEVVFYSVVVLVIVILSIYVPA